MPSPNKLPFEYLDLNEMGTQSRGVSVLYGRRADGTLVAVNVADDGSLSINSSVTINASDIKIGAVEIQDESGSPRVSVRAPDKALGVAQTVTLGTMQVEPVGSTQAYFSDNVANAVSDVAWTNLSLGFSSISFTIINDDLTKDLLVSFNGAATHMKLKAGDGQTMDFRRQTNIWLRSATAGTILYRTWAY